jgi:hypothetical protein
VNILNGVKKIDTYKTVFQSEALSIDQIDELFRGHTTRIPGVKMYVSGSWIIMQISRSNSTTALHSATTNFAIW